MTNVAPRPELVINYAPELDLRFTLASAQGYGNISLPEIDFGSIVDCDIPPAASPIPTVTFPSISKPSQNSLKNRKVFSKLKDGMQI
jgi:hypothetical protein